MKNFKSILITVFVSILISIATVYLYQLLTAEKIAFVRTGYVLSKYERMIDANKLYEEENLKVQTNIDTLRNRYEYLSSLQQNSRGKKKNEIAKKMLVAEDDYNRYTSKALDQLEQRRVQLSNEVIMELNSTIEEFGKKYKYKVILGSTDNGSLLYGDKGDDISEEILKILNQNYKPNNSTKE